MKEIVRKFNESIIGSIYRRFLGGRIARTTFVIRVAILSVVVYLLLLPITTILATSSEILRDAYRALFLVMLAVCLLGFVGAYVKRLHDFGLRGYWALAALAGIPVAIVWGIGTYASYRYHMDNSFNTADANDLAFWLALVPPLLFALWRGDAEENRFGPVPPAVEHFTASTFSIVAVAGAALILIPTAIYVGLFQDGVWVGRGESAEPPPMVESGVEGIRFMRCWNLKGVGAGSGQGPMGGVFRDGYRGGVFEFLSAPDGLIDIAMAGNVIGDSYRSQGFRIIPYGLKARDNGLFSVRGLDRFMLVAIHDQGVEDANINYTTFAFSRIKDHWPEWEVVMTTGLSSDSSSAAAELVKYPTARGRLMVGDCAPF